MKTICVSHLNLEQIADSGQCFRWEKQKEENSYHIPYKDHCLFVTQQSENRDEITISCTEKEWETIWHFYFDMDTDYAKMDEAGYLYEDLFLQEALNFSRGMRILRQDFWEVLVSFLISQNNNIPRIKASIGKICEKQIHFKTPEEILSCSLSDCGLGYRDEYLLDAARWMLTNDWTKCERDSIRSIKGIGPKVEACLRLYGLHELSFCPMDTWMKRIVKEDYMGIKPKWMESPYAGYYQQLCFYYKRNQTII